MKYELEILQRYIDLLCRHDVPAQVQKSLIEKGLMGDLLRTGIRDVSRRDLRRALGHMPFNSLSCQLGHRGEISGRWKKSEGNIDELTGSWGAPLRFAPNTFASIVSASEADSVNPEPYEMNECGGRIYFDVDFGKTGSPHSALAHEIRQDGFYPGNLGDLARLRADSLCSKTQNMWIASLGATSSLKKGDHFFVVSPLGEHNTRTLHLMTWPEIADLAARVPFGFLGVISTEA